MKQWSVADKPAATLLAVGDAEDPIPTLIQNVDPLNTLYVGNDVGINPANPITCAPLPAGQSMVSDGTLNVFGIAAPGQVCQVNTYRGVSSFFLPASLSNIGGAAVFVQPTTPTATGIPVNSLWFNTANGSMLTWTGSTWSQQQFSGSQLIIAATILSNQIANAAITTAKIAAQAVNTAQLANQAVGTGQLANNAVGTGQIANGAVGAAQVTSGSLTSAQLAAAAGILGAQIAAATITSSNIAANTIIAANIAANTITAAQLAAGIVYAGIVDGTTVQAATFIGGNYYGYNTPSPPALDALILSLVPGTAVVADPATNNALPGVTSYGGASGNWTAANLRKGGVLSYYTMQSTDMSGTWGYAGQLAPTLAKIKTTAQTINSTAYQLVTWDSGVNQATISQGVSYRIKGMIRIHMGGVAGGAGIYFSGPGMTFSSIGLIGMIDNANLTSGDYFWLLGMNSNFAPSWAANAQVVYWFDGFFVPTAGGQITLNAYEGTSGSTFSVDAGSFMEVIPVVQG